MSYSRFHAGRQQLETLPVLDRSMLNWSRCYGVGPAFPTTVTGSRNGPTVSVSAAVRTFMLDGGSG